MNLTFLIPVKLESEDRVRNLKTILTYLLTKFDAKVLVQEQDTTNKFTKLIMPYLTKRFGVISHRFQYFFDKQNTNYFHKTKILNDLLLKSDTEMITPDKISLILISSFNFDCMISPSKI